MYSLCRRAPRGPRAIGLVRRCTEDASSCGLHLRAGPGRRAAQLPPNATSSSADDMRSIDDSGMIASGLTLAAQHLLLTTDPRMIPLQERVQVYDDMREVRSLPMCEPRRDAWVTLGTPKPQPVFLGLVQLGLGQQWHKPDIGGLPRHHLQPVQPMVAQPWETPPPPPPPPPR